MGLYKIYASFIFKKGEKWQETSRDVIVDCCSDDDAKLAGLRWVQHAVDDWDGWHTEDEPAQIGCVKVYKFTPARFVDGVFVSYQFASGCIYEWKRDWYPYEKEIEHISDLINKTKGIKT